MEAISGGQIVARFVEALGLPVFFNVPGESFLPVLDAFYHSPVNVLSFRHESGAGFSAEAFAKLTGRTAVVMATRGPGASNLSIAVQTAHYDGTPLIALIGDVPTTGYYSRAFQEVDYDLFYRPISKSVFRVHRVDLLPAVLRQAQVVAESGRPGPAVVTLPADVLGSLWQGSWPSGPVFLENREEYDCRPLLEYLDKADRPIVLAALSPDRGQAADQLAQWVEMAGLPVVAAWRRFSSYPNDDRHFIGSLGLGAAPSLVNAVKDADLVLGFGPILEHVTAEGGLRWTSKTRIIQIDEVVDPVAVRQAGSAELVYVHRSPLRVLQSLSRELGRHQEQQDSWQQRFQPRTQQLRAEYLRVSRPAHHPRPGAVHLDYAFGLIDEMAPDNAVITSDAGNFAQWLLRYLRFVGRRVYLGPVNGAMGYGLPAGIGAALAQPGRPVITISGDGGFLMTAGEMETAVRAGISLIAVVVNNARYGTIRANQERMFPGRPVGTELGMVDFSALARSLGWQAWRVTSDDELAHQLKTALATPGLRLIELIAERESLALG